MSKADDLQKAGTKPHGCWLHDPYHSYSRNFLVSSYW